MNEQLTQSNYLAEPDLDVIIKNTPEEEALRLADSFSPITATGVRGYAEEQIELIIFTKKGIIELAHYIQKSLPEEKIVESAKQFCEDYKPVSMERDEIVEVWFDAKQMELFLKWCEPREKTLFD